MNGNGCRRCGHCCVAYINIPLTKEEVAERLYAKKWGASALNVHVRLGYQESKPRKKLDWSEWVVKRAKVFDSELGREVFACVYWDSESRECLIFEDRPQVCRGFDCNDKERGAYVHTVWQELEKAEIDMDCLHT